MQIPVKSVGRVLVTQIQKRSSTSFERFGLHAQDKRPFPFRNGQILKISLIVWHYKKQFNLLFVKDLLDIVFWYTMSRLFVS